jgi:hypothetical protein
MTVKNQKRLKESDSAGQKEDNIINDSHYKEITKTFVTGQNSCTLVIPKSVALEYGLSSPSHVVVEKVPDGILIRRLRSDI